MGLRMGGPRKARPVQAELLLLLGRDAKRDPPVQGYGFELNVEAIPVAMRPRAADAGPKSFASFAVAHLVRNVARGFAFGLAVLIRGHRNSPFALAVVGH